MSDMCTQTWLTGNRIEGFAKEYRRLKQAKYTRKYMQKKWPEIKGESWGFGGISNCKYTGVYLRTILLEVMDLDEKMLGGKHLVAICADKDQKGEENF